MEPLLSQVSFESSMSCPCGLSQERVLEVAEKHDAPLTGGLCQNPFTKSDRTLGICGRPLGDHPLAQGNYGSASYHAVDQLYPCSS